jgi:excisionase family DNA binding protein
MTIIPDQRLSGEQHVAVMEPEQPDPLLTTGEAAVVLEVAPQTVARWADDQVLECSRTPGGHRRFRTTVVLALRAQLAGLGGDRA